MYINYYNAVKTLINQGLNDIKTIDWYNNQYDRLKDLKAVKLPAVYIEFPEDIDWKTAGNGLQTADTKITLHLVKFDIGDSPEPTLLLANELHKKIHQSVLLDGINQLSTKLTRVKSKLVIEYDQLKVVKLTYSTTIYDCTTAPVQTAVTPISLIIGQQ